MKKTALRILSVLLAAVMLLGLAPVGAFGATVVASGYCGVDADPASVRWSLDSDGVLTISGAGQMRHYQGSMQTSSYDPAPWYELRDRIRTVRISSGVENIGASAFFQCGELTEVSIPDSVTAIGSYVFYYCSALTSVTIPDSVTAIGSHAFYGCSALTSVRLPSGLTTIEYYLFYGCAGLTSVTIPDGVTSIQTYAFGGCTALNNFDFPSGVSELGSAAFANTAWYNYQPDGVVYLGKFAFKYKGIMPANTALALKSGTEQICENAFSGCTGLTSVTIPSSVTVIGENAFSGCAGLTGVYISDIAAWCNISFRDNPLSYAHVLYLNGSPVADLVIPDDMTRIGGGAFSGCTGLTSVTIPNSVIKIGYSAFSGCTGLKAVSLQNPETELEDGLFQDTPFQDTPWYDAQPDGPVYLGANLLGYKGTMPANTSLTLKPGTKRICGSAFSRCKGLTGIALPEGLTSIGLNAFSGCTALTGVTLPDSLKTIYPYAFSRCASLTEVSIPDGVTQIGFNAFNGCAALTEVLIPDGVTEIESSSFNDCTALRSVTIPDSVTRIDEEAFYNCSALTEISIPDSVTEIGEKAFAGCKGLKSLKLPAGTPKIRESAFVGCEGLTSVEIPNTYTRIADYMFYGCTGLESFTLPEGVTTVYRSAFNQCTGLKTVTISTSVKIVRYDAFQECENLTDVYYDGSEAQWKDIVFEENNEPLLNATVHFKEPSPTVTYTVSYDANGGVGTPSQQRKTEGEPLTLSADKPSKAYTVSFNSTGGSVSPASKNVSCSFNGWNTQQNGGGTAYAPGASYTVEENVTLWAQWTDPVAGELPTPKRSGYNFDGWYTSASGGTEVKSSATISENTTVFAHWSKQPVANVYNLGDETYQFDNYRDSDSPEGHCFGMSITSAGYYLGYLDIQKLGGSEGANLYSFPLTQPVKAAICYYQPIQGPYALAAVVAGGSYYKNRWSDIESDWSEVVAYVKNHDHDNKGTLQIGFRKDGEGGHAINFLRYENIDGQDRIYAYDNNFSEKETYFYRGSDGKIYQAPVQTFSGAIDCIALRDVNKYFQIAKKYDASRAVYIAKDLAVIQGLTYYSMEGEIENREYVMYEIPDDQSTVRITPSVDFADFIYMGVEYSFGEITDDTYGELRLQSTDEHGVVQDAAFKIFNGSDDPNPTDPHGEQRTLGDITGDGKVNSSDARKALRAAAKLDTLNETETLLADMDGNGKVNSTDARKILRIAAKLDPLPETKIRVA